MENIARPTYINHILKLLDKGMIIILVGQRRVGKSFILRQMRDKFSASGANVIFIDKELHEFNEIIDSNDLYEYVKAKLAKSTRNYLLIDEVQDIRNYEDAVCSLQAEDSCQIIATGSNAYIFSSELSTKLSGRYVEIPIHGLSYEEFLKFHDLNDNDDSLQDFLRVGGLPALRNFDIHDEIQVRDYLQSVYSTIMFRDVISREEIRNVPFMENLSKFVADNIGKLISVRNITNSIKSHGGKVSEILTSTYLKYLCAALIISPVARYDIHGRKLFEQNSKYYFTDHGLRNLLCGFNLRGSIEKIMENVVWEHLKTLDCNVNVGVLRNGEVDFVATKGDSTAYIQTTYLLGSEDTIRREFGNLKNIKDNYPKYVVSMDPVTGELPQYPGIRHIHLREFLKSSSII
jgi:predicted AAA+ superfamily ATPase